MLKNERLGEKGAVDWIRGVSADRLSVVFVGVREEVVPLSA